ncbi:UNVERIFIED_CONTAM: hypothetical protein Slati_2232400 [Sesamum latifolium]|uniref:Uncharacterized protein n=1 Tax=Sesamum latifolium TaxID=2727402 RepID=A0AAW2WX73_9LAMI
MGPSILQLPETSKLSSVIIEGEWHWPPITAMECNEIIHNLPHTCRGNDLITWRPTGAIREQLAALAPAHVATPSDVDAPEEEAEGDVPVPAPPVDRWQGTSPIPPKEVPLQWLARFEFL